MKLLNAGGGRSWLDTLRWATRALWGETGGFRFEYPLQAVPEAGPPDSLHYYVYSDRLFFEAMRVDADGVPRQCSRTFEIHNPAYVAWYGLVCLERSLRGGDACGRRRFLTQIEWLTAHAERRGDGAVVWPLPLDWREGDCILKAPWISAMAQGLVASALVRAHRITGDASLLDLSRAATRVFGKSIEDGGVRTLEQGHALYEEYPAYPLPRVLDGFLFGLLGLYDVSVETGDATAAQLFVDGIDGLAHMLPFWDYRGRWSWYGAHGYLCPPQYNRLNVALLAALERLSGDARVGRYARLWDPTRLGAAARVEVFLVFLMLKNRARLRYLGRRP